MLSSPQTRTSIALARTGLGLSLALLASCNALPFARNPEPAAPIASNPQPAPQSRNAPHGPTANRMNHAADAEFAGPHGGGLMTDRPVSTRFAPPDAGQRAPFANVRHDDTAMAEGMEGLARMSFATEGSDFDPSVSRDGKTLVFASTQHRATSDIYIKQVGSRTVTQLTSDSANDAMPIISPEGQRVAFCSDRSGSWHVYVMSIKGGQAVQLTDGPTHDLHPSWSSDGRRLVFSRLGEVSGRWEMWVIDIAQPASGEFVGYGLFPQWCPASGTGADGTDKIAFQRSRERGDRAFSLWTIDYRPGDAGNPTEIVGSPGFAAIGPTWSPDGQFLAYSLIDLTPAAGPANSDLWITAIDGTGRVRLTSGRATNLMPEWGADGRVYFVSDRGNVENIWSIGAEKAVAAATAAHNQAKSTKAGAPTASGEQPEPPSNP